MSTIVVFGDQDNDQSGVLPLDSLLPNTTSESSSKLADEQHADETLQGAFHLASQNKGGYFFEMVSYFTVSKS